MIVKKYTGKDETEAVMKAKDDLGSNAVVLNVRTMKQRGLAKIFKKDFVEITAALEEKDFAQNVNNNKPTFSRVSSEAIKKQQSQINLLADDRADTNAPKQSEIIEKKLDSLHDMLRNQMVKEEDVKPVVRPENNANFKSLKLIYNKLLENEVSEKYANAIINDIENSMKKESNLDSILASVYQKIILKFGEPEAIEDDDRRKIVFFIGPTGVGKTTTIAKLASDFKLTRSKNVAMITADTYRIAAVEQLNTYASILDVPVNVIYSPSEIVESIEELSDYQMIFVDTAGRSHKNTEQRDEIIEMISNVRNSDIDADIVIFLVMSVTTKYRDMVNICDAYKSLNSYRLLFTKLDETDSVGNILNIKLYTGAPISYITCGQNVPDDIESVDVQKLAKSLLGGE
ncbi:MAG TPA: flagellar biosynthesis protein FlhF [Lachnospiraceae bacterium]|jgi:flagellar biosynthesis protein FlhF|nr:flagellar biosynthesis protein FlhF [Butyrivibrio sp. CAG:318]HJI31507.1 flagellar biosynthesis protein FlhF [Lachnospiraceae bacterium]